MGMFTYFSRIFMKMSIICSSKQTDYALCIACAKLTIETTVALKLADVSSKFLEHFLT